MKFGVLISIFLVFISCKNVTEKKKETEQTRIAVDSLGLKIKTVEKRTENANLVSFLENPLDLQEFKIKKKRIVTTSVTNGMEYHFNPKLSDSLFYNYYYHYISQTPRSSNQITVFKYGQNKHTYDDKTEQLIEFEIRTNDSDLGKANLIGLTKTVLESGFGADYLTWDNGIAYSDKNRVLILEMENSKVKSYRYVKLNTEKIDQALIGEITQ